jgi:hypothetical protein
MAEEPHRDRHRARSGRPEPSALERISKLGTVSVAHELGEGPLFYELRIVSQHTAERSGDGVHQSRGRNQHRHRRRVLHEGSKASLFVARDFKPSSICQIPQAEEHRLIAEPVDGRANYLQKPPSRTGLGSNLDERAGFLALHTRQGPQDELDIVRVDELESRQSDRLVERPTEQSLCCVVSPLQSALWVKDDHRIGKVDE